MILITCSHATTLTISVIGIMLATLALIILIMNWRQPERHNIAFFIVFGLNVAWNLSAGHYVLATMFIVCIVLAIIVVMTKGRETKGALVSK